MSLDRPTLLVFSSLYPSQVRPNAGVFIRERMTRVAEHCAMVVVSPVPWFPFQSLIRLFKPNYRLQPASHEHQAGIEVYFPRFFALPGIGRTWDGLSMALSCVPLLFRLKKSFAFNVIDAHFAYPDGYAATWLGRWFDVPVTITLRGTEVPLSRIPSRRQRLLNALHRATVVFSVADALKRHVVALGADATKIHVVGNGVDNAKFHPIDRWLAREQLKLADDAQVLISVGGLVDRKGYHRVIEILPELLKKHPKLVYVIVGGASPEGDNRLQLERQIVDLGLQEHVRFLGAMAAEQLHVPLSAADIFVLATANEGWANVFLEAMACGLPVVTTDVGGNREVVSDAYLGTLVPFGDAKALTLALGNALNAVWDRQAIMDYASQNSWNQRISQLLTCFNA
ncbi:MAG: hypothetical protein RL563_1939, partial [Pseudomonadota bacterium]